MRNSLRSLAIFSAMVATPFVLHKLVNRRAIAFSDWQISLPSGDNAYLAASALLVLIGIILIFLLHDRLDRIATYLTLAERDLNNQLSSGLEHGSRRAKVSERAEWNKMAQVPATQIFAENYKTVAHELVAENEKDLQGKGAAMGRASITAFLLRELYDGNVDAAKAKIVADTRNNGKLPYVAPGIQELVGFHTFTPENGFKPGSGVDWGLLRLTVFFWGFPRSILMVKTDGAGERRAVRNRDVLADLTGQKI